jgi:AraC-like DNA-binding protein
LNFWLDFFEKNDNIIDGGEIVRDIENMIVTKVKSVAFLPHQGGSTAITRGRACYGISFCISGHISFEAEGKVVELTPGSAVLLPHNGTYSWTCHKTGIYPQINFETDRPVSDKIIRFEIGSYSLFDTKLKDLQNALITSSNAKSMSIFYDIIDSLGGKSNRGNRILTGAIDYMLEHFGDASLSNDMLASQSGISEIYFRRLFKEMFGTTPKQYILGLRIKKACKLLIGSPQNISEIAEECGFSSVYHFCRSFKENTGLTPSEYAKKNKSYYNI